MTAIEFINKILVWCVSNKDELALLIAFLSLAISVWQVVGAKIKGREQFTLKIDNLQQFTQEAKTNILLSMTIVNHSSTPLVITRIYFYHQKEKYLCRLRKVWSGEHYYPMFPETDIPRTERVFSSEFPIVVAPNGANYELIRFDIPQVEKHFQPNEILELEVITEKHKKKYKLPILENKEDMTYL